MSLRVLISFAGVVLIALAASSIPGDLTSPDRTLIAIALIAALLWTLEPVPIEWTALSLLFALPATGYVTFQQTFSAFGSKAIWLVFAGMVISHLITETSLADRISTWVARHASGARFILLLHGLGLLLAVLIPSGVVRVLIIMPVLVKLLSSVDEPPESRTSAAIILSVVCATYYGGTGILTASVPNLVIMGVLEAHETPVYWGPWAAHMFPVIGLVRVATGALLVFLLFRPKIAWKQRPTVFPSPERFDGNDIRALLLIASAAGLWATDVFHGIHPVLVGMGVAVVAFMPRVGPLNITVLDRLNYPILIYIGSVFAIGEALVAVGTSGRIATALGSAIDLTGSRSEQLIAITWAVAPFNFLVDTAVVGSIVTPPLLDVGAAAGITATQVGLAVAVGTGLVFIPYQGAPFMLAYSFRYVTMGQFIALMALICLVNLFLLVPFNLAYWSWIGLF